MVSVYSSRSASSRWRRVGEHIDDGGRDPNLTTHIAEVAGLVERDGINAS